MTDPSERAPARRGPSEVIIALSSFNGARFIEEQVESVRRQTFTHWTLLVRDDGSSDATPRILEALARKDCRIRLVRDDRGNLGPVASFGVLLECAREMGARYLGLADQDDVWHRGRLARELDVLRQREAEVGSATPLLVHSDLAVVAQDLRVIHPSYLAFQRLRHVAEWPLGALLVQNFVTGCTVVLNRALLETALPFPPVIMHDWWLALCAAAVGEILFVPEATVLYRQHDDNTIGSRGWRDACRETVRRPAAWWRRSGARFAVAVDQARELARRLGEGRAGAIASSRALAALRDFSAAFAGQGGAWRRLSVVLRHGIRPRTVLPFPVFYYLRVLLWQAGRRPFDQPAEPLAAGTGGGDGKGPPAPRRAISPINIEDGHG